jgi:acetyltransferase
MDMESARRMIQNAVQGEDGFLDASTSSKIIQLYGIQIPPEELTQNAEQAVQVANRIGNPVTLKVVSPDLPHKSDIGGVLLGLTTAEEVREGFADIMQKSHAAEPQAKLEGVLVQSHIRSGQDVIVGVVRDAQFGPLVMFGSGGIEVEALRDVAFSLAPVTRFEAQEMLDSTWAGRRMSGYRNLPAVDREAVLDALLRLGHLTTDIPQVIEVEINPLRALPGQDGVMALDCRIRVGDDEHRG